MSNHQERDA